MPGKTAIIRAAVSERQHTQVNARGRGKSARTAATRALLNLLKQQPFRRQSSIRVQLDLSIISADKEAWASEGNSITARIV